MKSPSRPTNRNSSSTYPVPKPLIPATDAAGRWLVFADLERAYTAYTPSAQIARRLTLGDVSR